jgi:hypothetical protein
MGTRSITYIVDRNGKVICKMYLQYDGYPSGHGLDLAEFLTKNKDMKGSMGWLAAKLISHFYEKSGDLISPEDKTYCCEDYVYVIRENLVEIHSFDYEEKKESSWEDFSSLCNKLDPFQEEEN